MKLDKKEYYDIYREFYEINKYRELKNVIHHGNSRLNHLNRVGKLSFIISKKFNYDYISCTRGALMHDFFTTDDIDKLDKKYKDFLKNHPQEAFVNSSIYFEINEIEENIILSHMYPFTKLKPQYKESKVVNFADKTVSLYEFFRYEIKANICYIISYLYKINLRMY